MKKFFLIVYIILSFVLSNKDLFAQSIEGPELKPDLIPLGGKTVYTLKLKNTEDFPALPDLILPDGLEKSSSWQKISSPKSYSSVIQIVNGKEIKNEQKSEELAIYQIQITPKKTGDFTIDNWSFVIGNKVYNVEKTNLKVFDIKTGTSSLSDLELSLIPENISLYEGQSAKINLFLLVGKNANNIKINDFEITSSNKNISCKVLNNLQRASFMDTDKYTAYMWQIELLPKNASKENLMFFVNLDLSEFTNSNSQKLKAKLSSNISIIDTMALPDENKPENFSGAIGMFTMQEPVLNSSIVAKNHNVTMQVDIKSNGKINSNIKTPEILSNENWQEVSSRKIIMQEEDESSLGSFNLMNFAFSSFFSNNLLDKTNKKSEEFLRFEYVLKPLNVGKIALPEIKFSFFNPDDKTYTTLESDKEIFVDVKNEDELVYGLNAKFPKGDVYVGQAIELPIEFLFNRQNIPSWINKPASLVNTSNDFTTQAIVFLGTERLGDNDIIRSWQSLITPIKAGQVELSFVLRQASSSSEPYLLSKENKINVLDLPAKDKPEFFTGAIGKFSSKKPVYKKSPSFMQSDPIYYNFSVNGKGNFPRINFPQLNLDGKWKILDTKSDFQKQDQLGYEGEKTFTWTLVCEQVGQVNLPSINFNYFDPISKKYIKEEIKGDALNILPNLNIEKNAKKTNLLDEQNNTKDVFHLIEKDKINSLSFSLLPLFENRTFLVCNLAIFIFLLLVIIFRKRSLKFKNDEDFARKYYAKKQVKKWLKKAKYAAKLNDESLFYRSAVRVIQFLLVKNTIAKGESISISQANEIMQNLNILDKDKQIIISILEDANMVLFGKIKLSKNLKNELNLLKRLKI